MRNVFSNGTDGISNLYWGIKDDQTMFTTSDKSSGMPILFVPYKNLPDCYLMKVVIPGQEEKYVSYSEDGNWLTASCDKESDAMPVKMVKKSENNNGSYKGTCFKMQNYYRDKPGQWVSFTTDDA